MADIEHEAADALQALMAERDEARAWHRAEMDRVDGLLNMLTARAERAETALAAEVQGARAADAEVQRLQSAIAAEVQRREDAEGERDEAREDRSDFKEVSGRFKGAWERACARAVRLESENAKLKARVAEVVERRLDDLSAAFVAGATAVHIELRPDDPGDPEFGEAAQDWAHHYTHRLCEDCPPTDYPTDETRCQLCPRRAASLLHQEGE